MNNTPITVTYADLEQFVRDNAFRVTATIEYPMFDATEFSADTTYKCLTDRFDTLLAYCRDTFDFTLTETAVTFNPFHLDVIESLLATNMHDDPNENTTIYKRFFAEMTDSNIDDYDADIEPFLAILRMYADAT